MGKAKRLRLRTTASAGSYCSYRPDTTLLSRRHNTPHVCSAEGAHAQHRDSWIALPPRPSHSPTAKAQTPLSGALGYLTPEEEVLGFYAALEARDFTDAYSFLSPAAQAERPFAAWVDGYAMTQRIDAQTFAGSTPDSVSV